jgi:hypothetical protein
MKVVLDSAFMGSQPRAATRAKRTATKSTLDLRYMNQNSIGRTPVCKFDLICSAQSDSPLGPSQDCSMEQENQTS